MLSIYHLIISLTSNSSTIWSEKEFVSFVSSAWSIRLMHDSERAATTCMVFIFQIFVCHKENKNKLVNVCHIFHYYRFFLNNKKNCFNKKVRYSKAVNTSAHIHYYFLRLKIRDPHKTQL